MGHAIPGTIILPVLPLATVKSLYYSTFIIRVSGGWNSVWGNQKILASLIPMPLDIVDMP